MARSLVLLVPLTVLFASRFLSDAVAVEVPRSCWTAKELRCELLESQQRIRSFRVAYRSEYYEDSDNSTFLSRVVAAKHPSSFYIRNSHPCDAYEWNDDPILQIAHIGEDLGKTEFPFTNSYFITALDPESPLPGTLPTEFYMWATGVWPLARKAPRMPDGNVPVSLRDVAESDDYTEVRPFQENVNNRWCHVLVWPGHDSLWIDVRRGCALLARESFARSNGARMHRLELIEHRECAPGIWLPTKLRNIQFDTYAMSEKGRCHRLIDSWTTVDSLDVNNVPDSLFEFQPPPGALLVFDHRFPSRDYPVQVVSGGQDLLDRLAEWVRRRSRPEKKAASWASHGWCAGFMAFPLILFLEVRRRVRRRAT